MTRGLEVGCWGRSVRGNFLGPSCHVYGVSLGGLLIAFLVARSVSSPFPCGDKIIRWCFDVLCFLLLIKEYSLKINEVESSSALPDV